jgi:hypothetical protein
MTAAESPAGMPSHRAGSQRPQPVLFVDTTTGQLGAITQRPGDSAFVFHPREQKTAGVLVDQPGRFALAHPDDIPGDPRCCPEPPAANTPCQGGCDRPTKQARRGTGGRRQRRPRR